MNLKELFEMQKKLDEHIIKEKGLDGQDLLPKKILALQVELGELANEWRGFKFWSNNQEPSEWKPCAVCSDQPGYLEIIYAEGVDTIECPICEGHEEIYVGNKLLEEYVDCLHFILSIGLDLQIDKGNKTDFDADQYTTFADKLFRNVFMFTSKLDISINTNFEWMAYKELTERFLGLGVCLGFTAEQIVQAYKEKNKVNHERQEQGY